MKAVQRHLLPKFLNQIPTVEHVISGPSASIIKHNDHLLNALLLQQTNDKDAIPDTTGSPRLPSQCILSHPIPSVTFMG